MSEPKFLTLEEWAAPRFTEPPSLFTLRMMARNGKFSPPAVKIGKAYYVEETARVIDPNRPRPLVERLKSA
jgi:hypothetical protein